jgi:type VI secretion system secreted protein Hcp
MQSFNPIKLITLAFVALAVLASGEGWAETLYMTVEGKNQGVIQGGVVQRGKEGAIQLLALSHQVVSPRDVATGQATGKRQHKPIVIRMAVDKSFTKLYQAMVTNESLSSVEIKAFGATRGRGGAIESNLWTIKLQDASVADINSSSLPGVRPNETQQVLDVSFTYQKIEWTWLEGDLQSMDYWDYLLTH